MKLYKSDYLDDYSNAIINKAIVTASSLGCGEVNTSHLMAAIITSSKKWEETFYKDTGRTKDAFINTLKNECKDGVFGKNTSDSELELTDLDEDLNLIFEHLVIKAQQRKDLVHTDDLYYAIIELENCDFYKTMNDMGVNSIAIDTWSSNDPLKDMPCTNRFGIDMCKLAKDNKFDPIEGRDNEINTLIEVLGRRQKANPCLIGDPGVGKTAIVEGLAQKIVSGDVPKYMIGKHIINVSISNLISGSKFRGELEERVSKLISEISEHKNCILFLDEFHMIMESNSSEPGGNSSMANVLKPALSKGDIRIIGATTVKEYRKYIELDPAFERRIQSITIEEPSIESAIKMVSKVSKVYEQYHNCSIGESVIEAAVKLSDRYITDKRLPDKAISIIDETAARLKKIAVDNVKFDIEVKDIRETISKITKIDINDIDSGSKTKLQTLEDNIKKNIIGQDEAVKNAVKAIRRAKAGIKDPNKPIASFMFVGPTGVGKTELTKIIATEMTGSIKNLIRLDMSEYMEKHTVSRLIGAPPGYVGFTDGGQLTDAVRRNPNTVILFDEIEKAHSDIFNIMLQILDDGTLTDSKGVKVDFKNTIIVMTSNAGYGKEERHRLGFGNNIDENDSDTIEDKAKEALEKQFRPEFINRIDKIVVFKQLTKENCVDITKLELSKLSKRLKDKNIDVTFEDSIINHIVDIGYSEKFGARNIKRRIQTEIEDKLADYLIDEIVKEGDIISVSFTNETKIIDQVGVFKTNGKMEDA